MNVKRLRWEQVENSEGTIWGQVRNEARGVAYLLEAQYVSSLRLSKSISDVMRNLIYFYTFK